MTTQINHSPIIYYANKFILCNVTVTTCKMSVVYVISCSIEFLIVTTRNAFYGHTAIHGGVVNHLISKVM